LRQALATMARLHAPAVPVVQHGRVLGQVRASHAASLLAAMPDATVDAACEPVPTVRSEASLREALAELDAHPRAGALAVLDAGELVGWLTHREVLAALAPVEDPVGPIVRTPEPVAVR
jgi:predicted transcriptional regulator